MKSFCIKYYFVLLCLLFTASAASFAQGTVIAEAKTALSAGSSKALARYFSEMVEISLDDEKASYSKTQAEFVLKDFFARHPVQVFEIVHEGTSKEGLRYAIGKYKSTNGTYRVYMLIKQSGSEYTINMMDFSQE